MSAPGAPTRSNRERCWESRDAYYGCLTQHGITTPPGTDMSDVKGPLGAGKFAETQQSAERESKAAAERMQDPCAELRDKYEGSCSRSWVSTSGWRTS